MSKTRPFGMLFSTSSFISSTGDCAMIGKIEVQKQQFITHNLNHLQIESAQGAGEFIDSYARFYSCSNIPQNYIGSLLQNEFPNLYGSKLQYDEHQVFMNLEGLFQNDQTLRKNCTKIIEPS